MLARATLSQRRALAGIVVCLVWFIALPAGAAERRVRRQVIIERSPTCGPSNTQQRRWRALAAAQPRSARLSHLRVRLIDRSTGHAGKLDFAQGQSLEVAAENCGALVAELDEYIETLWPTPPRWRLGASGGYRLGIFRESAGAAAMSLSRSRRSWAVEFGLRYSGGWLSLPQTVYGPEPGRIGVHQVSFAGMLNFVVRGRARSMRVPLGVGLELATLTLVGDEAFGQSPRELQSGRGFFPALLIGASLAHVPVHSPANLRVGVEFWCTLPGLASLTFAGSSSSGRDEPEYVLENLTAGLRIDIGFEFELRRARSLRAWTKPRENQLRSDQS